MTLDAWMEKHAKTDEWVAAQTGFDRVTISRTRRRVTQPSWALAAKLKALTNGEVTADDFLIQAENEGEPQAEAAQ